MKKSEGGKKKKKRDVDWLSNAAVSLRVFLMDRDLIISFGLILKHLCPPVVCLVPAQS